MPVPRTIQNENVPTREDATGDFVVHVSQLIAMCSGIIFVLALLAAMAILGQSRGDITMAALCFCVALCSFASWTLAIAWIAFWPKFKRLSDDVYAIRQHLENPKKRSP